MYPGCCPALTAFSLLAALDGRRPEPLWRQSQSTDARRPRYSAGRHYPCPCFGRRSTPAFRYWPSAAAIRELNVALGGTLHQFVQSVPGKRDHREDQSVVEEQRYGPVHSVFLRNDGYLARLFQTESIAVNSLHEQGIDTLAPDLITEAWTEDGLIEAIRAPQARAFTIGVQWHPEWQAAHTPYSGNSSRRSPAPAGHERATAMRQSSASPNRR